MEISVLILSCVILGLNPVLPVLLYFFNFTICNLIWILPNKIHTYIHLTDDKMCFISAM